MRERLKNVNQRKEMQEFAACQCGCTILEERKVARTRVEEWAGRLVPHHEYTLWTCVSCGMPVLSHTPRNAIEKSILEEMTGDGNTPVNYKDFVYKTIKIDVNKLSERNRRFISRPGVGGDPGGKLPTIDPNTPLVEPKADDE
jgi:hypothetical protein